MRAREIIDLLIAGGADVNHRNKFGQTALSSALENCMFGLTELLLAVGAERDPSLFQQIKDPNIRAHLEAPLTLQLMCHYTVWLTGHRALLCPLK